MILVVGRKGRVLAVAQFGGQDQPALELAQTEFVVVGEFVQHFERARMHALVMDGIQKEVDFFLGDPLGVVGVDRRKERIAAATIRQVGIPGLLLKRGQLGTESLFS